MGTMNVETSWLGDAMNNMFNEMEQAPNNAAKMALTMEQIKKARAERIKEENVLAGAKQLGEAYDQAQGTYKPPEYWTPQLPNVDPNAPEGSQWDVSPSDSIGSINVPRDWTDPQGEAAHRKAILDYYGKTSRLAALTGKTSELPGLLAYGQVGAYGVPQTDAERAQLQFQTKGEFPVIDETKLTKQNYA